MVKRLQWTPELVSRFWDGIANTELDNLSFGRVAGPAFLDLVKKYIPPGHSVLDFGAGSGHFLQLLLDRGILAAGFEPSADRAARLAERIGRHDNFLGVFSLEADRQFDVVILMEVIEHVLDEDFNFVLERASKFVKPSGYLIVTTPNNENLESSGVYCPVSDTLFHPWQHVRSFTPPQLVKRIGGMGFARDFVGLVDFSADANLIERYKDRSKADEIIRHLLSSINKSVFDYRQHIAELNALDVYLSAGSGLGLLARLKWRIDMLLKARKTISALHRISHGLSNKFDALSSLAVDQLSQAINFDCRQIGSKANEQDVDVRIGKETTIIYVGKKFVGV